jgi:hypothetical protein
MPTWLKQINNLNNACSLQVGHIGTSQVWGPTITTRVCSGSLLKSSRRDPVRLAQVIRDLKTLELETQRAPETPTPKTCEYTRNTWQNAIPYTHL